VILACTFTKDFEDISFSSEDESLRRGYGGHSRTEDVFVLSEDICAVEHSRTTKYEYF
jgi:hypothetical protein